MESAGRVDLESIGQGLRVKLLARCARQALRRYSEAWGATAVGYGRRQKAGSLHRDWCLKVYVPSKPRTPRRFTAVPAEMDFRVCVNGSRYRVRVTTDVIAIGRRAARPQALCAAVFNENSPAQIGSPTAWVRDDRGQSYLLAAGHVVARNLQLADAPLKETVVDSKGDFAGTLARAPNLGRIPLDVGLVRPAENNAVLPRPAGAAVAGVRFLETVGDDLDEAYWMFSWRKRLRTRFVALVYDYPVEGHYAAGTVVFRTLIHFEAAATGGDSGALVVDAQNRAVGMHILGVAQDRVAFALPMEEILARTWPGRGLRLVA